MDHNEQTPMRLPHSPYRSSFPAPPTGDYYLEVGKGQGLSDYLAMLLRRKWWVIGPLLTMLLLASLYLFINTPMYRPKATFQITQDNPGSQVSTKDRAAPLAANEDLEKFQQTQYNILRSRSLALRVIKELNLSQHPYLRAIQEGNPDKTEAEIEAIMVDWFLANLEVTPVRNSYLVEVAFLSPDKELAQKIINAISNEYMYLVIDRRNESFALVRNWLDKQLQDMAGKVQQAQKKLYKFGQKTDIYTLDDKDNVIVQKFIDLSGLLTKAQADKMRKEGEYKEIKEGGSDAPLIVNHPLVARLREQLVVQQAKVSGTQRVFRDGHPELQAEKANLRELQGRLNAEVNRLRKSAQADFEAASRTEKLLQESLTQQKERMVKLQENLSDYQILKRDSETNEQLYQALLSRVKEANIASTMVPSNVAVIDPAPLPSKPFKPNTMRILGLATFIGLILGLALALLRERTDNSIKTAEDLEQLNLSSLGAVPLLGKDGFGYSRTGNPESSPKRRLLPWQKPSRRRSLDPGDLDLVVSKYPINPITEAIRHTETAIMLSVPGRPPATIMVTSANPSEGKTMVSSNLGQSFALHGRPTLIIDCDLRKPKLHQIFELDPVPGLTDYLTNNASLEEIIRPTAIPNLMVITSGSLSTDPGNLLSSEAFKDLLTQMRQQFRHLIIDTPPILAVSDGRVISALVDGVLLVTKHYATEKKAVKLAHQLLSQIHAPIMGAVLNCLDISKSGYDRYRYLYDYDYYSNALMSKTDS